MLPPFPPLTTRPMLWLRPRRSGDDDGDDDGPGGGDTEGGKATAARSCSCRAWAPLWKWPKAALPDAQPPQREAGLRQHATQRVAAAVGVVLVPRACAIATSGSPSKLG